MVEWVVEWVVEVGTEGVEEMLASKLAEEVVETGKIESDSTGLMSAALGRAVISGSLTDIALGGTA